MGGDGYYKKKELNQNQMFVAYPRGVNPVEHPGSMIIVRLVEDSKRKNIGVKLRGGYNPAIITSEGGTLGSKYSLRDTVQRVMDEEGPLVLTRKSGEGLVMYKIRDDPHLDPRKMCVLVFGQSSEEASKAKLGIWAPDYEIMRPEVLLKAGVFLVQLANTAERELGKMRDAGLEAIAQ